MSTSSRTSGAALRLVGMLSFVLIRVSVSLFPADAAPSVPDRFAADPPAAEAALELARDTMDAWVLRHERVTPPDDLPALLRERSGVFVSAMLGDAPRCCMGSLHPTLPTVAEQIVDAAWRAAAMDLRFAPIAIGELPRLRVIVSIVEPPVPVADAQGLDPAADGLAVRCARGWGVVLPRETPRAELIEPWARIRVGALPEEPVDYYRVRAFRIVEPPSEP